MSSVIRPILPACRPLLALALLLIVLLSAGCGLKGDLYLPEAAPEAQSQQQGQQQDQQQAQDQPEQSGDDDDENDEHHAARS